MANLDGNDAPNLPPLKLARDSALLGATDMLCAEIGEAPVEARDVLNTLRSFGRNGHKYSPLWLALAEVFACAQATQVEALKDA